MIILDNASQFSIMKEEMLSDHGEITNGLFGAIDGYCARCRGRGKCPKPFEDISYLKVMREII